MPRRRALSNISLATRLSLVALLVTLVSLAVTATVGLVRGSELAGDIADDQLVTVAASRATAVEVNVGAIQSQLEALASSPATAETILDLGGAYRELAAEPVDTADVDELTEFYIAEVVPELEEVRGSVTGVGFLVPDGSAALHLQSSYVVPDEDQEASGVTPELVLDPGDGSTYSELHPSVHQTYGQIALRSGFDDFFLIDATENLVLYSVRKRIDFATSLEAGPHSGSALARLVDRVTAAPGDGAVLSDFAPYVPAGEQPRAFVASDVVDDDGRVVGVIAASLSVEAFDAILSGDGEWAGAGRTGDVYLVGSDGLMRTTSRAFARSPSEFLAAASQPGPAELSPAERRRIAQTGTTALVQPVDRRLVAAAAEGPGLVDTVSYQGDDVRTAYRHLAVDGVSWTIVSEVGRSELDDPIEGYALDMLLAMAIFVVAVTFVAVRWSDRVVAPIRSIAQRLRSVRAGDDGRSHVDEVSMPSNGPEEYEELADNVDQMLARLAERRAAVETRSTERIALLRQFLPAAVARRSEESDGEVLDHVRNASVVVVTLDGIGELVGDRPDQEVRDLLADIVDEVDALATDFGLERIKLTGATYYAVCGATRPYLDHPVRAVGFALATRDLVDELSGSRLAIRCGVASGAVSVGLAARSALVYDVWGDTVTSAEHLVEAAPARTVMVTESVRSQLPADLVTSGNPVDGAVAVTGRLAEQEAGA